MKKELKSGILSADKSADGRPTVGGVNVIAILHLVGGADFFPLHLALVWRGFFGGILTLRLFWRE